MWPVEFTIALLALLNRPNWVKKFRWLVQSRIMTPRRATDCTSQVRRCQYTFYLIILHIRMGSFEDTSTPNIIPTVSLNNCNGISGSPSHVDAPWIFCRSFPSRKTLRIKVDSWTRDSSTTISRVELKRMYFIRMFLTYLYAYYYYVIFVAQNRSFYPENDESSVQQNIVLNTHTR